MRHCHEALSGYPLVITIPVIWGDQDAFGHVNNTVHLRWCETARVDYLIRIGMWPKLPPEGTGPILASIACDYRRPVTYPDTLLVGARVTKIGSSSMRMEHAIVSQTAQVLVAEAHSTIVLLDYARGKTVPIPAPIRHAIEELEGKRF